MAICSRNKVFLKAITLVKTLPCLAEPGRIIVVGKPSQPLSKVIPYLATLPDAISYNPETCTLTFRRLRGFMTLYADKVYITQVKDIDEGLELLNALADAVNATWTHRAELVPVTSLRKAPRWLDIWTLLPQTNCKQCGKLTCMAFAAALLQHKRSLADCPVLVAKWIQHPDGLRLHLVELLEFQGQHIAMTYNRLQGMIASFVSCPNLKNRLVDQGVERVSCGVILCVTSQSVPETS